MKKLHLAATEMIDSYDIFELEKKFFQQNNPTNLSNIEPTFGGSDAAAGAGGH